MSLSAGQKGKRSFTLADSLLQRQWMTAFGFLTGEAAVEIAVTVVSIELSAG